MAMISSSQKPIKRKSSIRWRSLRPGLLYTLAILCSIIFLIPFYLIVRNALMTELQISADWIWFPFPFHFDSWTNLFTDQSASMLTGLQNSAIIAVCQVFGQLLFASMAGYAMARIPFRWNNLVFFLILVTLMVPGAVTFIPTYLITSYIGWVNTLQGIIAPGLFSAFSALLFRQFYLEFPQELEDAGRIDGLGHWGIYWHLVIPTSRAIMVSLGAIAFINSWNAFLWPLVIGQDASQWTVQVVLSTFLTQQSINLPELFMGAAVGIFPLVIIFFIMQRYIMEGVSRSGIKG